MSKYGAVRTTVDNITFASKAEANYYAELKLLKRAGEVEDFKLQPRFTLQDSYIHKFTKKRIAKIEYVADFWVIYTDGRNEIVDVKGIKTPVYAMKKKIFEYKYPDLQIKEVI